MNLYPSRISPSQPHTPMTNVYPRLVEIEALSSDANYLINTDEYILFFGFREQAFSELWKCKPLSLYFIRSDQNRQNSHGEMWKLRYEISYVGQSEI